MSLPLVSSLVLPLLADFMREHPAIELDLDFRDRLVDMIEEGFDAVVRTGELIDSRLSVRRLGAFSQLLVASPDYLLRCGTPATPADLAAHACLHYCYRYPATGKAEVWPLLPGPDGADVRPPTSMACNNMETRLCFALLPDFCVRESLAAGRLQRVLAEHVRPHAIGLGVPWPSGRHPSPKLWAFVDFLVGRMFVSDPVAV